MCKLGNMLFSGDVKMDCSISISRIFTSTGVREGVYSSVSQGC